MPKAVVMGSKMGFNVNAPVGKASTKKSGDGTNPFPGRRDNDSMRGKAGVGQNTTTGNYAGKGATSTGFVSTRARELGDFKGSVSVSKLQHTGGYDNKNRINGGLGSKKK